MANEATLRWTTYTNQKASSSVWLDESIVDQGGFPAGLLAGLEGVSSASLTGVTLLDDEPIDLLGALASPYDAADKLVLQFEDDDGFRQSIVIPAPLEAMFLADDETVDKDNAAVSDLIDKILSLVITAAGVALKKFIKGWRTRRNRKKVSA